MARASFLDEPKRPDGDPLPGRIPKNGRSRKQRRTLQLGPAHTFKPQIERKQRQRVSHAPDTLLVLSKQEQRSLRRRTGHHSARQERIRIKLGRRWLRAKAREEARRQEAMQAARPQATVVRAEET